MTRADNEIIAAIYRTVENPDHWSGALRAIVEKVGGDKAIVFSAHMDKAEGGLWALHEIDQQAVDIYQSRFANCDPRRLAGIEKSVLDGRVMIQNQLFTRNEDERFKRTEYYNEFDVPFELYDCLGFAQPLGWNGYTPLICLSIFHRPQGSEFGSTAARRLADLKPHIEQAFALRSRIACNAHASTARALVQILNDPAVLLDRDFRILAVNLPAEKVLSAGRFLNSIHGQLQRTAANSYLFSLLNAAFRQDGDAGPSNAASTDIRHGNACVYNVMPVNLNWPEGGSRDHVIITMRIRDRHRPVDWPLVRAVYGLTVAETKVASLIIDGLRPEGISATLSITRETLRTHIKRVLNKTGNHKQSEFVRTMLTLFAS